MTLITALGLTAGALTTLGFVPQVVKTWRTKSGHDLSFGTFGALLLGAALWLTYGVVQDDAPLIAANSVSLVLQLIVLGLMIRYRGDRVLKPHARPERRDGPKRRDGSGAEGHRSAEANLTRRLQSSRQ